MPSKEPAQVFPYYRSPHSIRNEVFSQRLRGLDADEVDEYLNLLA
ncbi:MAG: DivIVA domain-containing protein, partial [Actinomycetes bacterium]